MGKIVAPRAYVTIGISCAIQRLAGVKDSNVIIEIIKDHVSPISSAVDCGLNGDLCSIVPYIANSTSASH